MLLLDQVIYHKDNRQVKRGNQLRGDGSRAADGAHEVHLHDLQMGPQKETLHERFGIPFESATGEEALRTDRLDMFSI